MKKIKVKDIENCLHKVLKSANEESGYWQGDMLAEYCESPFNRRLLHCLEQKGYVSLLSADNDIILAVIVEPDGYSYFSAKRIKFCSFIIKSILVPILVAAFTAVITILIDSHIQP